MLAINNDKAKQTDKSNDRGNSLNKAILVGINVGMGHLDMFDHFGFQRAMMEACYMPDAPRTYVIVYEHISTDTYV